MSFVANLVSFIDTYPFLFLLVILIIPAIFIIAVMMLRRRNKQSPVTIINQAQPQENNDEGEKLEITGRLDEQVAQRLFGIGRKIKNAIIGISLAIPFAILSYIISENLGITVASIAIFVLFGWYWANKWVRPEGVQLIRDGDNVKGDPSSGVMHEDLIVPYEQWKLLQFEDPGGAYPIKTINGLAYRVTNIEFWDAEHKIIKSVELAWMHNPHSNFEQEHNLNHRLEAWLKITLKTLNSYRHLNEIASIVEAKRLTDERERIRYDAKSSPARVNTDIDRIMSEIKEYEKEEKNIRKTGKETKEKVDTGNESETTESVEGGDAEA